MPPPTLNAMDYARSGQDVLRDLQHVTPALMQAAQQLQQAAGRLRGGAGTANGVRVDTGPFQRIQRAQGQLQAAMFGGTGPQVADAQANLRKALQAMQPRGQDQSFAARLARTVASTRVNMGPISPLLGQATSALSAAGPEGMAAAAALTTAFMGIKIAIDAAETGIKTFVRAVLDATDTVKGLADARIQTGGNTGNVAFLRAFGLDPSQISSVAGSIRERLASSPFGMVAGHRVGVGPVLSRDLAPGVNEAGLLQNVVRGLAGISDASERFRQAVRLDATSLLPQVEFYRRHRAAVEADSAVMAQIADPALQQAAGDMAGQLDRVKSNFMSVVVALAKPFLGPISGFLGRLSDKLRDLAVWLDKNQAIVTAFRDALVNLSIGFTQLGMAFGLMLENWGQALKSISLGVLGTSETAAGKLLYDASKGMKDLIAGNGSNGGLAGSLSANTQALNQNTAALQAGTFGGGDRTRRATQMRVPGTWMAADFDRAVAGAAYRLGAF